MNKPEDHIIQSLLEKHALGICTPEEITVLNEWYDAFPEAAITEKGQLKADMKAAIMENIQPKKVRRMYWQIGAAAAVLILIVATYLLKPASLQYTTVMAPKGKGVMKLELPDQSVVWVQPGSSLRYAGRQVELIEGMAGFSVTANSSEPFMVSTTSGLKVKVLGTAFTVKAFRELSDVKVHVESGAVQISDSSNPNIAVLKASQQLVYNIGTHQYAVNAASPDHWKEGEYVLDNVPFAELARVLKDLFDADIQYDEKMMSSYRFNIKITRQSTLAEVFDMLKDISGVQYMINGNRVTIMGVNS